MGYSFNELESADLVIDAIYKGGTAPNMSAEPFHKLIPRVKTQEVSERNFVRMVLVNMHLLLKNPFNFNMQDVIKNDSQKRISVTLEQQERFLEFIKTDKHYNKYYDAVYILFHTGIRISEFCGLTLADIDMKERIIHVGHQLLRLSDMQYVITQTKTGCGIRDLPMTQGVYECFQRILKARRRPKVEPMIDNKIGFCF